MRFSHIARMTATESFSAYLTFRLYVYGRERVHGRVVLWELHYQLTQQKHNTRPSLPFSTKSAERELLLPL